MPQVTVAANFVRDQLEGAVLQEHDAEAILKAVGIPVQVLTNPRLRVSTLAFADLSAYIAQLLQDETFGFLEKPQTPGTVRYLMSTSLAARTVEESLRLWKTGTNLLSPCISASFRADESGGSLAIEYNPRAGITNNSVLVETLLTTPHRAHCWLARQFIPIEKVELTAPKPSFAEEYRYVFYGAPVLFGQPRNAITISRASLDLSCNQNLDSLNEFMEAPFTRLLTQARQTNSLAIKVRLWMEKALRQGHSSPQLEQVAEHLGLTPQTLRRRLRKDGYAYNKLKEDTRRDMAVHLIGENQLSVEEIAFQLGFSEASTFIRAFKKWTGVTPLAYRKL